MQTTRFLPFALIAFVLSNCMTTDMNFDARHVASPEYKKAGSVTVELSVWNIFFLKSPAERRDELIGAADRQAKSEYGDESVIANHRIESRWSLLSLVLSLDLIGFVELGTLQADVMLPAPPLPVPEPEYDRVVRVSYPVLPRARFEDRYGYVELEYLTRQEIVETVRMRLDKQGADAADDYEREYAKIPDGGHVLIYIGRQDLMHANTRWYSYRVSTRSTLLVKGGGEEGIPNIKGRDGNWWNVVTIPLDQSIDDAIMIEIHDAKLETIYEFSVERIETIID